MRILTTLADLLGGAAVTFGVSLAYVPAGWIVGGGFVLFWSYVAASEPKPAPVDEANA